MKHNIMELRNAVVEKSKKVILHIPRLEVSSGEVLAIAGANGAGKSTLLLVLAGVQKLSQGKLMFKGRPVGVDNNLFLRRRVTLVMQDPLLLKTSVFNNVALGLYYRGLGKRQIKKKVEYWLGKLGIEHLAERWAFTLSGGEARRVSLARALVLEPEVLLLDEPFSGLDTPSRVKLLEEVHSLLNETGITTVFVSHDFQEIRWLAHKVAVLDKGKIVQQGDTDELLNQPSHSASRSLVEAACRLSGGSCRSNYR